MYSAKNKADIVKQTLDLIDRCNRDLDSKNIAVANLAASIVQLIDNIIQFTTPLGTELKLSQYYSMELGNLEQYLAHLKQYNQTKQIDKLFPAFFNMQNSITALKTYLLAKSDTLNPNQIYKDLITEGYLDKLISLLDKAKDFALSEDVKGHKFPSSSEPAATSQSESSPRCRLF